MEKYSGGNSLDKALYIPGDEIPTPYLAEKTQPRRYGDGPEFPPGHVGAEERVGNRHPMFLSLPFGRGQDPP